MMYAIHATRHWTVNGWRTAEQLPTFYVEASRAAGGPYDAAVKAAALLRPPPTLGGQSVNVTMTVTDENCDAVWEFATQGMGCTFRELTAPESEGRRR